MTCTDCSTSKRCRELEEVVAKARQLMEEKDLTSAALTACIVELECENARLKHERATCLKTVSIP